MKKTLVLVYVILIVSNTSIAKTKIIIENRVFDLVEQQKDNCGKEKGDPEYTAAILLLNTSQNLAQKSRGPKAGIQSIFEFVRQYPSRFSSDACASLRDECETRCLNINLHLKDECKIECNQYETWNK